MAWFCMRPAVRAWTQIQGIMHVVRHSPYILAQQCIITSKPVLLACSWPCRQWVQP